MIHFVAPRSQGLLKVFVRDGSLWKTFSAGFDAWGNYSTPPPASPWGFDCWMPPGHFILGAAQFFDPIPSEGYGQIPVSDMDADSLAQLVKSGYATCSGLTATIGGVEAPIGQLAQYDRSAIMLHGGGSNAPDPYAAYQPLCRTNGCTRLHNADFKALAAFLQPLVDGNVIVYTAIEAPAALSC